MSTIDDRAYIVLANEGEKADADTIRFDDAIHEGLIDPNAIDRFHASYPGDEFSKLGRVWISTIDGDFDQDGDIDLPSVLGGRSFSILDAQKRIIGLELWFADGADHRRALARALQQR